MVGTSPRTCEIPVTDSKKLKSSSKLPFKDLLAGLVPFVELANSTELRTDEELLRAIGVDDAPLVLTPPIWSSSMGSIRATIASPRKSWAESQAKRIQVEVVRASNHPKTLNELFDTLGNKSSANTTLLFGLLREVLAMGKHGNALEWWWIGGAD